MARPVVSLTIGLLLLLGLGWVLDQSGNSLLRVAPLSTVSGLGDAGPDVEPQPIQLEITRSGETPTLNLPMAEPIDARRYDRAVLVTDDRRPEYQFAFAWVLAEEPSVPRIVLMERVDDTRHEIDLSNQPDWNGTIQGAAFVMGGPTGSPVTISQALLSPVSAGIIALYRDLLTDWMTFEGWSGHSVNFIRGWRHGGPVSPVVAVALWVFLSMCVYAVWSAAGRRGLVGGSLVFIFMAGWVTLDLRWQVELARQLAITHAQYSGKTWEEKRLSAEDGELFAWVQTVKEYLGDETRRVFVVAARDYSYPALRAKYHLLPHNADHQMPRLEHLRADDYLLLLSGSEDRLQLSQIRIPGSPDTDLLGGRDLRFTAEQLDGSGSELVADPDAPGGYARVQRRSAGDLMTARTSEPLPPGYYNLRFALASRESPGDALIRVGAHGGRGRPEHWFMRRVAVNPNGYTVIDLGVVLSETGHVVVRVTRASPGLLSAGVEIGPLEWRREPLLVSSGNLRRLLEPVLLSPAGTLYRIR